MKSKYTPLVKLKKKALDQSESALIKANTHATESEAALERAYEELSLLTFPTHGSIGEFTQSQMILQAQHREIELGRLRLEQALAHQNKMRDAFQAARIEYEKFNYLELQEAKAHMAKIKKEEAKMLDEIGTMTYKKEFQ